MWSFFFFLFFFLPFMVYISLLFVFFSVNEIQSLTLELGAPIVHCSIADPYVLLLTEEGDTVLLTLKPVEGSNSHKLVKKPTGIKNVSNEVNVSIRVWIHSGFETKSRWQIKVTCGPTNNTDIVLLDKISFGYGDHFLIGEWCRQKCSFGCVWLIQLRLTTLGTPKILGNT